MKKAAVCMAALLALGLVGCMRPVDVEAERARLLALDAEFAKTAQRRDLNAFLSYFADEVTLLPLYQPLANGKEAVRKQWEPILASPNVAMTWEPVKAEVSGSGDLGYTIGTYEQTVAVAGESSVTSRGKYVTIWRKQRDGQWKIVLDAGTPDQPPVVPSAPRRRS